LVNSYELYNDPSYLKMARDFVYNQIPRYGFHKGVWNGEVYYWTEYNPSGAEDGKPVNDSTDNVIALVADAVAKVGYHEQDPVLRSQLLEYARGLLWYMVREFTTDGRFYYDGAENPINTRKSVSHDLASVLHSYIALAYL